MNDDDRRDSDERSADDDERTMDVRLHLLDRQMRDVNDRTIGVVDDVELSEVPFGEPLDPDAQAPEITDLLTGPVLATRIFGGRPPKSRWHRISWDDVANIDVAVELGIDGEELSVMWIEQWMRDHIIARIPGGRHDPQ
ncbi:hypothetical protein [Brevibacterium renqingii]|uniref:hypothetical protein n=1 Tax=Brevibacterium renqingii TaxID=2776916 RepID=UPI001ADF79AC|nr:hypothetical protein [Brevibacterium renqingii]